MRIGIAGYGKLGQAVEQLALESADIEITGIFTRRGKDKIKASMSDVYDSEELWAFKDRIDIVCLCYGSSRDMPKLAPKIAGHFNTVDVFDNHELLSVYKASMNEAAKSGGHTSLVALGWDPGFMSVIRLYSAAYLPNAVVNTFWGRGVSQGHSEALRGIDGVIDAIQYTVPRDDALRVAMCDPRSLSSVERHRRVCYIYAEKGKEDLITNEILSMENYFYGYEVEIHFVSGDEIDKYHGSLSHRGRVYACGSSGGLGEIKHLINFDLETESNPDLTASIMLSGARVAMRLYSMQQYGAYDIFDMPPSYFIPIKCENANYYL